MTKQSLTTPPVISIICPTFNSEMYLDETIQSVVNQTYTKWELIIVDGGSHDSTNAIIQNYKKKCKKIQSFKYTKKSGLGPARNYAIRRSRGELIAFIDSDDIWFSDKLKRQINYFLKRKISFCYTKYNTIKDGQIKSGPVLWKDFTFDSYFKKRGICNSTVIVSKKLILSALSKAEYSGYAEDTMLWLLIMEQGEGAYLFPETHTLYRLAYGSRSRNVIKNALAVLFLYRRIFRKPLFMVAMYYPRYISDVILRRYFKFLLKYLFPSSIS